MTQAVVREETAEEAAYARGMREIADRRRRLGEAQTELAALRLALDQFEAAYLARVGHLIAEFNRLVLAIAESRRRIARLRIARAEGDERTRLGAADTAWLHEAEPEATGESRQAGTTDRPVSAVDMETLKRLYRELAWRFHPDLARTEEERHRRQELMLQVNAAFQARDVAALRALHRQADATDPRFGARPLADRMAWVRDELAQLDGVIATTMAELIGLRGSRNHTLWQRHQAGEPVIDLMERFLRRRIAGKRGRLEAVRAAFQRLAGDEVRGQESGVRRT